MDEIKEVKIMKGGRVEYETFGGVCTTRKEISREEYERLTAIDGWKAKLAEWCENHLPVHILQGYGFYGCDLFEDADGKCYYSRSIGSKCD